MRTTDLEASLQNGSGQPLLLLSWLGPLSWGLLRQWPPALWGLSGGFPIREATSVGVYLGQAVQLCVAPKLHLCRLMFSPAEAGFWERPSLDNFAWEPSLAGGGVVAGSSSGRSSQPLVS